MMVVYAVYLTYKACRERRGHSLECSRDELCSKF